MSLIVLDSVGCGELPDAEAYGDQGSNTLGNIAREIRFEFRICALGLGRIVELGDGGAADDEGARADGGVVGGEGR